MGYSLQEIANNVGGRIIGDSTNAPDISGVASIASAGPHDLIFIDDEKLLTAAVGSNAAAIVMPDKLAEKVLTSSKMVLLCAQPKLTFARAANFISDQRFQDQQLGAHPTAVVHQNAKVGLGASIGPH